MKELTVSLRDWAVSAVGFVSALLFFWGMSALVGWPNPAGGWEVVVVVAAVVAVIPLLGRTISYLQKTAPVSKGSD